MDFIWFVIRPERAVAPADGAEAFEGRFAEGWEGDADGFAVACYTSVGLLWVRHCRYDTAWSPMIWKVDALRCATRSESEVTQSPRTLRKVVLGKMFWWTKRNDSRSGTKSVKQDYLYDLPLRMGL